MNRTYRVVWSASRQAFIVASEFAKTAGKRSSSSSPNPKVLKSAIALAVGALCTPAVYATQAGCPSAGANTISSTVVASGCVLQPGDSVVITNTGKILTETAAVGVFGTSGAGNITNSGTLAGQPTNGAGILISSTATMVGNILNNVGGLITGDGHAIAVDAGSVLNGAITNAGAITSDAAAINLNGGVITGAISNTIDGEISSTSSSGIYAGNGSSISSINNVGFITGDGSAVTLDSSQITNGFTNSGGITLAGSVAGDGLSLQNSTLAGGISNSGTLGGFGSLSGSISGSPGDGISAVSSVLTGGISNSGGIVGMRNGIRLDGSSLTGAIVNDASGVIGGFLEHGISLINISSLTGNITNAGTLAGGSMSGSVAGVHVDNSIITGNIINSNFIAGGRGIDLLNATVTGGIVNSGTLGGLNTALNISGGILGSISNSGEISLFGSSGVAVSIGSSNTVTGSIINTGSIGAGGMAAIHVGTSSTVVGGIINSGLVANGNASGLLINGQASVAGGIVNDSNGIINANVGILIDGGFVSGGISNAGTLSTGSTGIAAANGATIAGGIANSGLINVVGSGSSSATGIYAGTGTLTGGVSNSGIISVSMGVGSSGAKANGILLSDLHASGGLTNSGTITTTISGGGSSTSIKSFGVMLERTVLDGNISNSGTISTGTIEASSGDSAGIRLHESVLTGNIINTGLIEAGDTGIDIRGDSAAGTITGSITNTGTIFGNDVAINVEETSLSGSIINTGVLATGSIVGSAYDSDGAAIDLSGASIAGGVTNSGTLFGKIFLSDTIIDGQINNIGTIRAAGEGDNGIDVASTSTVAGSIVNGGVISGAGNGVAIQSSSTISGITNSGTIAGEDDAGLMVYYRSSVTGNITNSGTIAGDQYGIQFTHTGLVQGAILNTGLISGGDYGVYLYSGATIAGGVTNSGKILSDNNAAIYVASAYTIVNGISNSGTIASGVNTALFAGYDSSVTGSIVNTGTISSGGGWAAAYLYDGNVSGGFTNGIGGVIGGGQYGLDVSYVDLTNITNQGNISGIRAGVIFESGVTVASGVSNAGSISGGTEGLFIKKSSVAGGGVVNSGAIVGGDIGLLIDSQSTITGGVSNSGAIVGTNQNGLELRGQNTIVGDLVNTGAIAGHDIGVAIRTDAVIQGSINNTGTVASSDGTAILVSSANVTGGLSNGANSKVLGKSYGINVVNTDLTAFENRGTVTGSDVAGVIVHAGSNIGSGFVNAGTITGGIRGVILADSVFNGSINNSGSIVGSAGSGVEVRSGATIVGGLNNAGTINAQNGVGFLLQNLSTLSGDISNSGLISGGGDGGAVVLTKVSSSRAGSASAPLPATGNTGIRIDAGAGFNGSITNSGSIIGGVYLQTQALAFENTGFIDGTKHGFDFTGHSIIGVDNRGTISSDQAGIRINSGIVETGIGNGGLIDGGSRGIAITGASTIQAGINNSGTITGGNTGVYIDPSNINGGIGNSGIISGVAQAGIHLYGQSTITGQIDNSGTINGGRIGVQVESSVIGGGITTSGTISGSDFAIKVDSSSSLSNINITGNNTAKFVGTVDAAASPTQIVSGAVYTMDDGQLFIVPEFSNKGVLAVAAGGTGTVQGNYAQTSDATFRTHIVNDNTYGKLVVTGTATLPNNAKIDVDVSDPRYRFTTRRIENVISAGTLLSDGTFALTDNSILFDFSALLDGNTVDLTLKANAPTGVETTVRSLGNSPASGAARVLDRIFTNNPDSPLVPYFVGLTTEKEVSDAVSQTLPLMTGGTSLASTSAMTSISRVVQARVESNRGLSSGDEAHYGNRVFWLKPFGSWADQDGRDGAPGFQVDTTGIALGGDAVVLDAARLGASFAYATADVDSDSRIADQGADIDVYQLIGYGSYSVAPKTDMNFHIGVGQNQNSGSRRMSLGGFSGTAKSDYDSLTATAGLGFGKMFDINSQLHFTPSARADYTWIRDESYDEKGSADIAPLLLKVDERKYDELVLGVDGKLNYEMPAGMILSANVGVGYDTINDDASITSAYAGEPSASFATHGVEPSPWIKRGSLGVSGTTKGGLEINVRYELESRTDFLNQTAAVKFRIPF